MTTNAHVLDYLCLRLERNPAERGRLLPISRRVATWLATAQHPDGNWHDKWHASPYYASACGTRALLRFASPAAHAAIQRSVDWVLRTQWNDGSWGVWEGNPEETAYALKILRCSTPNEKVENSLARALPNLDATFSPLPLWHGKELYAPTAIIAAVVLAARCSANTPIPPGSIGAD
ncbi:hypothetical protein [Streptomyces sp. NPDC058701]|uniref:hypothetical protein n=1 Tax=Streptomyces sp. NPDC058701 TaxID=3346608 RepID=UPI003666919A